MEDILLTVIPIVISFLIGLIIKSPAYQTTKKLGKMVFDAIEDDKITEEEARAIYEAIKNLIPEKK